MVFLDLSFLFDFHKLEPEEERSETEISLSIRR
jgi:hypothetical protein